MRNMIPAITTIVASLACSTSYAHTFVTDPNKPCNSRPIEGDYMITFKEPVGSDQRIIDSPNERNRGKVAFGEHTSGQNKQSLIANLNIKGEIVSILDSLNAIHVKMDVNEAKRFSNDKRVLRVEQNITGCTAASQTGPGWGLDRMDQSRRLSENRTFNLKGTIYSV